MTRNKLLRCFLQCIKTESRLTLTPAGFNFGGAGGIFQQLITLLILLTPTYTLSESKKFRTEKRPPKRKEILLNLTT